MSQTVKKGVPSKILVKNKNPGTISTGANTEVYIDNQKINGVSFLKFEFKPGKLTKIVMEMYAEVEIDTSAQFETETIKQPKVKIGDAVYVLSELSTVGIAQDLT